MLEPILHGAKLGHIAHHTDKFAFAVLVGPGGLADSRGKQDIDKATILALDAQRHIPDTATFRQFVENAVRQAGARFSIQQLCQRLAEDFLAVVAGFGVPEITGAGDATIKVDQEQQGRCLVVEAVDALESSHCAPAFLAKIGVKLIEGGADFTDFVIGPNRHRHKFALPAHAVDRIAQAAKRA